MYDDPVVGDLKRGSTPLTPMQASKRFEGYFSSPKAAPPLTSENL